MAATPIDPELRSRIEDFLSDGAQAIDDDEIERWPFFFTEDGFYQIIPRAGFEAGHPLGIMTCRGRGMMQDRVAALRGANIYEPHTYCHVLARPVLRRDADGTIMARTNFALYRTMQGGPTELFAAGSYRDRILCEGEELRLKSRRVVLESRRVDILIVLPI
ncbi:MAG TPA: aromatic-ring-hydroxylating dioxygenase subunit beta [Stellaceae bacterium]|nr:aromatic-ring-hydroxylating dioxygenase subunit beta [Stellaceae bacterium]